MALWLSAVLLFYAAAVCSLQAAPLAPPAQAAASYMVVVYGGTPGGISAAVAASRALGVPKATAAAKVVLIEPSNWIGGMASGGLGCTDRVGEHSYGGLAREFVNRTNARYLPAGGGPRPRLTHCLTHSAFEPHIATEVFHEMLSEAHVDVMISSRLVQVHRVGAQLTSLELSSGSTVEGHVMIDSSYEGDLLALAGVSFTIGREGQSQYNESLAGRRPLVPDSCYGFDADVDPYVNDRANGQFKQLEPEKNSKKLLPLVWGGNLAAEGESDTKVMSYNYRLCLTNATRPSGLRVEITQPSDYNPEAFELLRRYMTLKPPESLTPTVLKIYTIAFAGDGVKTDVNSAAFPISTNLVGGSWGYPNGTAEERAAIIALHKSYTKGLIWFLKTDPSVPPHLRREMAQWGWCGDEFKDNDHFPTQL